MLAYLVAITALLSALGTVLLGLAKLRMADAWKIWAGRIDPKNPNFQGLAPPRAPARRRRE